MNPEGLKGAMQMTGNGGGPLGEEVLHAGESPFLPDAQRSEPAFPPAAHRRLLHWRLPQQLCRVLAGEVVATHASIRPFIRSGPSVRDALLQEDRL
jgi:hypothetical protein